MEANASFYADLETALKEKANQPIGWVAISYIDLTTGKAIDINGDTPFVAASCIKVPLGMLVSDRIKEGKLSWEQKLAFRADEWEDGTGVLNPQVNDEFTIEELMKLMITESDNIAKNMLFNAIAESQPQGFEQMFAAYLPGRTVFTDYNFTSKNLADVLDFMMEHLDENEGYRKILQWMKEDAFEERLETPTTKNYVAHKIGSFNTFFNDMGVFSGKHPYILVVMTNEVPDANDFISQISDLVWNMTQEHAAF